MKVIDLETINGENIRRHIQWIVDTVCRELRVYRVYVITKKDESGHTYVLIFHFENNFKFSVELRDKSFELCLGWQTYGTRIIETVKREFLLEKRLTYR